MIRAAINTIAAKYRPGTRQWLAEKNPMALRQLDAQEANIDKAALAEDIPALKRALKIWVNTWMFWIKSMGIKNV